MKVTTNQDTSTNSYNILINITGDDFAGGKLDLTAAINDAAKELAKDYVKDNSAEILAAMNPVAVSNLAIAESAKLLRTKFIDPEKKN